MTALDKLYNWIGGVAAGDPRLFDDGDCARLREIAHEIESEIEERYMPLPLDADGVPIRVGDELECHANGYDGSFTVFAIGNGVVVGDHDIEWIARIPSNWFHVASFCTHVKHRTIEDVLTDLAYMDPVHRYADEDFKPIISKYAEEILELLKVGE